MPRLKAEEALEDARRNPDRYSATHLYWLVLAATESKEKAEEAFKARVEADLVNNRTPQ